MSGTGRTLTGDHPEGGLVSYVASCSHAVTRERHQSASRERLVQKQSWDQKGSCLVALNAVPDHCLFPRDGGDRLCPQKEESCKKAHHVPPVMPVPLPVAEVLSAPKLLRIWSPISHEGKASLMPAGSFPLSGSCWWEARPHKGASRNSG